MLAAASSAQQASPDSDEDDPQERQRRLQAALPDTPGTGAFPAMKTTDPGLPEQVNSGPGAVASRSG